MIMHNIRCGGGSGPSTELEVRENSTKSERSVRGMEKDCRTVATMMAWSCRSTVTPSSFAASSPAARAATAPLPTPAPPPAAHPSPPPVVDATIARVLKNLINLQCIGPHKCHTRFVFFQWNLCCAKDPIRSFGKSQISKWDKYTKSLTHIFYFFHYVKSNSDNNLHNSEPTSSFKDQFSVTSRPEVWSHHVPV